MPFVAEACRLRGAAGACCGCRLHGCTGLEREKGTSSQPAVHAVLGRSKQYAWRKSMQTAAATAESMPCKTGCQLLLTARQGLPFNLQLPALQLHSEEMVLSNLALCQPCASCCHAGHATLSVGLHSTHCSLSC